MLCIPEKTETFLRIELQGVLGFHKQETNPLKTRHFFHKCVRAAPLIL